jgi:hypothetical protein
VYNTLLPAGTSYRIKIIHLEKWKYRKKYIMYPA